MRKEKRRGSALIPVGLMVLGMLAVFPSSLPAGLEPGKCEAALMLCHWEKGLGIPMWGDLICLTGYAFCRAYIMS